MTATTAPLPRARAAYFLPRNLHPGAWWVWALGIAAAVSRTTNPWLLGVAMATLVFVVLARRGTDPWANAFRLYVGLAVVIVVMRVAFRVVFGGGEGTTVLLHLPSIPLPQWAAGIRLLGDVSAESLLGGLYDGLRLATMVLCLGAANALANPKRLLKAMPPALYEVGTAVVVALSVFPQLAESVQRVNRARRLRGGSASGRKALRLIVIPVLEDALDRSLLLAASMDSRGYGRAGSRSARGRFVTGACLVVGLVGLCVGSYATLDGTTPRWLAGPMLALGTVVAVVGFARAGHGVQRTRYRPDRWRLPELVVAASGVAVAVGMSLTVAADPAAGEPSLNPLTWPTLTWPPLLVLAVGALPGVLTPAPVAR